MRKYLLTLPVIAMMMGSTPAHAGFWSDLGKSISNMFSGAGITSGYTTSYGGTTKAPLVVTKFPPNRLLVTRQALAQRQQIRSNQFDVGYWLLTGIKVPPARVVMQGSTTPNLNNYYNGTYTNNPGHPCSNSSSNC